MFRAIRVGKSPCVGRITQLTMIAVAIAGCDSASEPADTHLSGIYTGEVIDSNLGYFADGVLEISHSNTRVTGTASAWRTGTLTATYDEVDGDFTGTFTFTGVCPGTATTTIEGEDGRLVGGFQGTDCSGAISGTLNLVRP